MFFSLDQHKKLKVFSASRKGNPFGLWKSFSSDVQVTLSPLHEKDLAAGYSGVFLRDSLEKKYPVAAEEFIWQWFFPQKNLTPIPGTKELRRYHLHESQVQESLKKAVRHAKLTKRVTSHIFRHSAVYPAQAGPRIFCRRITISGRSRQCWGTPM